MRLVCHCAPCLDNKSFITVSARREREGERGSCANMCRVYIVIKSFGALVFATAMTTRQFCGILLSCIIYVHPLSGGQVAGERCYHDVYRVHCNTLSLPLLSALRAHRHVDCGHSHVHQSHQQVAQSQTSGEVHCRRSAVEDWRHTENTKHLNALVMPVVLALSRRRGREKIKRLYCLLTCYFCLAFKLAAAASKRAISCTADTLQT